MKKLLTLLIVFTLVFAACPTDEEKENNDDVIGVWVGSTPAENIRLEIAINTWVAIFTESDGAVGIMNGTWTRRGNTLTLEISNNVYGINASAIISDDTLILTLSNRVSQITYMLSKEHNSGSNNGTGATTLTINNLSDYPLITVEYSGINFDIIGSGKDVSKEVNAGTKYIYFVLKTKTSDMMQCRTEPVTCDENKKNEFIFTNNTIITIATTEERDTLGNICKKYDVSVNIFFKIGDTGPGAGTIFFAEGGQYKECSGELGSYPWSAAINTAKNHKGGGYTNWRLPDRGELGLMYQNLHSKGLGGFYDESYWSSSIPANDSYAYYMNFNSGSVSSTYKSNSYRVRAVRAFSN